MYAFDENINKIDFAAAHNLGKRNTPPLGFREKKYAAWADGIGRIPSNYIMVHSMLFRTMLHYGFLIDVRWSNCFLFDLKSTRESCEPEEKTTTTTKRRNKRKKTNNNNNNNNNNKQTQTKEKRHATNT